MYIHAYLKLILNRMNTIHHLSLSERAKINLSLPSAVHWVYFWLELLWSCMPQLDYLDLVAESHNNKIWKICTVKNYFDSPVHCVGTWLINIGYKSCKTLTHWFSSTETYLSQLDFWDHDLDHDNHHLLREVESRGVALIGKHTPMLGRIGSYVCKF